MVNVVIVSKVSMPASMVKDIEAVDPSVRATNALSLYVDELHRNNVTEPYVQRFEQEAKRDLAEGVPPAKPGETLDSVLAEAEVVFAQHYFPADLAARAPKLRWVQFGGVGFNRYVNNDVFNGHLTLTNARGALASPIAEQVMTFIFMLAKNAPRLLRQQAEGRWQRFETTEISGKTVGIIGMGAIATQVANRAKCMGMKVIATRRSAKERETCVGCFDEVFPHNALLEMLSQSDFVVLALPLTAESRKLIGERELRAMKPTAGIVNIGRGPIIDEPVLIRALKEGWIAGAGLDVVETEPMPPGSELWQAPNVIISPHMAGHTEKRSSWVTKLFCDNLKRYISGEELINIVSKDKGY